jgi:hypothetical protein
MRSTLVSAGLARATAAALVLVPLAAWPMDGPAVRVEYVPPYVSVSATEASLGEILTEIGEKVGFTVALEHAESPPVTVSIERVSVDDALRQLLRTENHTILYRQGVSAAAIVDRIILLGAPSPGVSVADLRPDVDRERSAAMPGDPGSAAGGPTVATNSLPMSGPTESATPGDHQVSVGDLLRSQALVGAPLAPSVAEPARGAAPASAEESLAETTRRAQQALSQLVEGLERATRSLQQPARSPETER